MMTVNRTPETIHPTAYPTSPASSTGAQEPFELLETLALHEGTLRHAAQHLARMAAAAAHFGYPWRAAQIEQCLQTLVQRHPQGLWRVRLLLDAAGQPSALAYPLAPTAQPVRLQLAAQPLVEALSPTHGAFVRYKTTRRAHYEAHTPTQPDVFDTVLWNTADEITECTRGNVAVRIAGRWLTPAADCGLLPGVARALALQSGQLQEAVLRRQDLARVEAWAFLNSLRGWLDATLVPARPA
jgi:para-aminobenzoate synthetase/4-amino-4-deoxychorismate lyase